VKVGITLEKPEGAPAPVAAFALTVGGSSAEDVFRRILTAYGVPRRQFLAGHALPIRLVRVPLPSAMLACAALGKAGVTLFADKSVQKVVRESAWACTASGLYPFQKVGAEFLRSRRRAILADQMGVGKAQPVDAKVLRPDGTWAAIGSLRVGDYVVGSNGRPIRVIGVYPQGVQKIFELTFDDGAKARSTKDHLWSVRTPLMKWAGSPFKPMTLGEIVSKGVYKNKGRDKQWFIPVPIAPDFPEQKLPIAPYVLGALVANGCFGKSRVTHSGWSEQRELMRPLIPSNLIFSPCGGRWDFRLVKDDGRSRTASNSILAAIRELGLSETESHERFIPDAYLRGSVTQRRDLLQGLMDNDGCISKSGSVIEYNTTSPKLAEQVIYLVRSLEGCAWMSTRRTRFTYKGVKKIGRKDHRIRVAVNFCPFRVSWKRERYVPRTKYLPNRAIARVEPKGKKACVCIAVDAVDSLYITNDFALTHNTIQALSALDAQKGALVIAPPVVVGNWYKESRKWRPDLAASIWKRPYSVFPEPGEIRIASFSSLPFELVEERTRCPYCEKLAAIEVEEREGPPFDPGKFFVSECMRDRGGCGQRFEQREDAQVVNVWNGERPKHPVQLVVDEAHYVKSRKARRTIAVRAIASQCNSTWLLSGTPLLNTPEELWALCQAMPGTSSAGFDTAAHDTFGSWSKFVDLFYGKPKKYGGYEWSAAGDVKEDARVRLGSLMLRRMRADVLPELPKKTRRFIDVEVDETGLPSWGKREDLLRMSDEEVLAECAAEKSLSWVRKELALRKAPALGALLEEYEEEGEPVVVFSYHREPVQNLGSRPGWRCITGETPAHERTAIVELFQGGKLKGVAGTIGAMGVGVTLTASASVLFLDRDYVPANNLQAEDRVCRIGQTHDGVVVTVLQTSHMVDLRVRDALTRKERLLESLELGEEEVATEVAFARKGATP
jgi:hypothetical protein